ncbi:hypothetical protein SAMN05216601_10869 [Ectopseudomonas composti]|uniref:Uncharacterized protein n=1 Tax=Ectopseudomonas composti TaxID=658457 RepID=A0A1I5P4N2_9GAMM|nr:hypothetical protein [Pseudomonas composti]SFP29029.1 hypothetical protein SAMN05216601_10869 [Pseudomonas composti]
MNLGKARDPLRLVALLTGDTAASAAVLEALGERAETATEALADSVWGSTLERGLQGLEINLMVCSPLLPANIPERYRLRAIALMTDDPLTRLVLLQILGEAEPQARMELAESCWSPAMTDDALERERLARELGVELLLNQ